MAFTVWRVGYPGNAGYELRPRGALEHHDQEDFERQLRLHLDWAPFPSPFLSVFTDKKHAINWGRRCKGTTLYEITVDDTMWRAHGLEHEYLLVGAIPLNKIRHVTNLNNEYNQMRTEMAMANRRRSARHSERHYDSHGNAFSDEDEAIESTDVIDQWEYAMNH